MAHLLQNFDVSKQQQANKTMEQLQLGRAAKLGRLGMDRAGRQAVAAAVAVCTVLA